MIHLVNLGVLLLLLIVQTTIIPHVGLTLYSFDPLIPYCVYLGSFRSHYQGIPYVLAAGLVMDGLSGSPLGIFLSIYAWVYIISRWLMRFLQLATSLLMPLVLGAYVLIENLIIWSPLLSRQWPWTHSILPTKAILIQSLSAIVIGSFILYALAGLGSQVDRWRERRAARGKARRLEGA
jgi:hypothetical protein